MDKTDNKETGISEKEIEKAFIHFINGFLDIEVKYKEQPETIEIIKNFATKITDNIKDSEPEFSKTVDDNFWNLF